MDRVTTFEPRIVRIGQDLLAQPGTMLTHRQLNLHHLAKRSRTIYMVAVRRWLAIQAPELELAVIFSKGYAVVKKEQSS